MCESSQLIKLSLVGGVKMNTSFGFFLALCSPREAAHTLLHALETPRKGRGGEALRHALHGSSWRAGCPLA